MSIEELCFGAKKASLNLAKLNDDVLNKVLNDIAKALVNNSDFILQENAKDVNAAILKGIKDSFVDRLKLSDDRIKLMAEGLVKVSELKSPVGEVCYKYSKENGLDIKQIRVPFGVIGIIYESRPNVTADAFGLCFKTKNACVLKGGSDAIFSNIAIVKVMREVLAKNGIDANAVTLIEDTSRESVLGLMKMNKYVDLLIPRGGAGLIRSVIENSNIPVIETGTGNCHIFVDETADIDMAANIIFNAKTQRYGVCNACESLIIHGKIINKALPAIYNKLKEKNVEVRGDERAMAVLSDIKPAEEEDWGMEYLGPVISVKTVDTLDEAIEHINKYNTGHSESIITSDAKNAERFLNEVDAAAVYVNASTRFTDGFEFGLGAEIGISTQKLHARGPMGLQALTTTKFIVKGNGQIRS